MPRRIEKTVFISYRRADLPWALAIYKDLRDRGYDVFFDFQSINSGDFEQVIVSNIKARAHFLVLLTPSALERCRDPKDWLRREIEIAINEKRNIIPLFLEGFSFSNPTISQYLVGRLADLKKYNGINIPNDYFYESMERLHQRFLNVALDAVLHPVSSDVQQIVQEQKNAANQEKSINIPVVQALQPHSTDDIIKKPRYPSKSDVKSSSTRKITTILGVTFFSICLFVGGFLIFKKVLNQFIPSSPTHAVESPTAKLPTKLISTQPLIGKTDTPSPNTPTTVPSQTATFTETPTKKIDQIAFVSDRDGNYEIYIMNADGTEQKNLTNHPGKDWGPAWSPDGQQLAFVSERDGYKQIYVMKADGSDCVNITNTKSDNQIPVWSHDGKRIAFVSNRDGKDEIYIMDANGYRQTRLMNNSGYLNIVLNNISWSPDDSMITFFSERDGITDWNIYVAYADRSGIGYNLTPNNQSRDEFPSWSPNSNKIAFVFDKDGNADIYLVNSDGSGTMQLTSGPATDLLPLWSPDGKQIAFLSATEGEEEPNIYVMNSDGSGRRLLSYSVANYDFRWSTDSRYIMYVTSKDDLVGKTREIYIMNNDGTGQMRLTMNSFYDWSPMWRP